MDGTSIHHDINLLWSNNQPDNFIPDINKFSDASGQDYITVKNGLLHDVRSYTKHPFVCEFEHDSTSNPPSNYQCDSCKAFVDMVSLRMEMSDVVPLLESVCEKNVKFEILQPSSFCYAAASFGFQMMIVFREKYLDNHKVCQFLNDCNVNDTSTCDTCIYLLSQFKKVALVQDTSENNDVPNDIFALLCQKFYSQCGFSSSIKVVKDLIAMYLTENNVVKICEEFKQC